MSSKFERQIGIMKALHEPKNRTTICRDFNINDRTFRNYFNNTDPIVIDNIHFTNHIHEIENSWDITMDGINHDNEEKVENKLLYKSSINPILLPLNMTEIYMLTNGLLDIFEKDSEIYKNYKHLAQKIYSQLSPYALKRIGDNRHNLTKLDKIEYESELELYDKVNSSKFMYAEKSRDKVKVYFEDGSTIIGRVNRKGRKLVLTEEDSYDQIDIENMGGINKIEII